MIKKVNRRNFLVGGGAAVLAGGAAGVWSRSLGQTPGSSLSSNGDGWRLSAAKGEAPLLGVNKAPVRVWNYNGAVPGPELRIRQGERLRVVLENGLDEGTTIHWHGVRVPNAMDGVPHLTQAPVEPGQTFVYEFVAEDAGTFWYHPHQRSFEQVGRGLYGPLIIEETEPIRVDRDLTWVLDDWRLDRGQIGGGFGSRHDTMMAGRIGNTSTINGTVPASLQTRTNERIRLRLINAANARIFGLDFAGHKPIVIAIDGQPVEPHELNGPAVIGPAMRMDLILDMSGAPGSRAAVNDVFYEGLEYQLTQIQYSNSPLRSRPLKASISLPPNPLAEPVFEGAQRHEVRFGGGMMGMMGGQTVGGEMGRHGSSGGMMSGGMMGGGMMGWTVNGVSASGHVHDPILTIPRGRTAVLNLINDTAWWHPIHLHGHSFRVISRNGAPTAHKEWQDTVLMAPQETAEIAFVADNPGDWMFHCHILEHQAAGMMATIRVK